MAGRVPVLCERYSRIISRSLSLNSLSALNRSRNSAGISSTALQREASASVILSSGTLSKSFAFNASRITDLVWHRHRKVFRLLKEGTDSPSMIDNFAGVFV